MKIYYEQTDPADAKPGDFLLKTIHSFEVVSLFCCVRTPTGLEWCWVYDFKFKDHLAAIVDGKPTPALIARFTTPEARESGKRFYKPGNKGLEFIKTASGITVVTGIEKGYSGNGFMFHLTLPQCHEFGDTYTFDYKNLREAESERERLIAWLEGGHA